MNLAWGTTNGRTPTGVAVDANGKIWVSCFDSHNAMRINPTNGVMTNGYRLGQVDLAVDLGNGTNSHQPPHNQCAWPYNYSDMTGFNNRVVNPGGQPLKGYWTVIEDCGLTHERWQRVAWSNNLPTGCSLEVFVRASNNRRALANLQFASVTNNVPFANVIGRYLEVRVGLTRTNASQQPVLYDLTLFGVSSTFVGGDLQGASAQETNTATFWVDLIGPAPITYQWSVLYPWTNQWLVLTNETAASYAWTNVDQWENGSWVSLSVSNAAGETLQLGPNVLTVLPMPITIPGNATNSSGPASRYPATIHVRGEPTKDLYLVEVTLANLSHAYPADLDILLVSPSGKKIMLMSDAGFTNAVTNATLVFHRNWIHPYPPETNAIPSNQTSDYRCSNFGDQESQLPGAPAGPYGEDLNDLVDTDPNGIWELYIYDDKTGDTGVLQGSWSLKFYYDD